MGVINGFNVAGVNSISDGVESSPSVDNETVIETYLIPANYFKEGDIIQIQCAFAKRTTGNLTSTLYWNDTPDLTSATALATSSSGSVDEYLPLFRNIAIVSNTSSLVYNPSISIETDFGDAAGNDLGSTAQTVTGTNWSQDGYLVLTLSDNTIGTNTQTKYYFTVII